MKESYRKTKPLLHYGILILMYAVATVTLVSHTVLHAQTKPESHHHEEAVVVDPCKHQPSQHKLVFTDNGVIPRELTVKQCDTIAVLNKTTRQIELAIGSHPHHIHYPGFKETTIEPEGVDTFRATQSGTYTVHDHDNPVLKAQLTVKK